jgi:hypothetical protein
MRGWLIWLVCTAVAVASLAPNATARVSGAGDLRRPLHLPHLATGAACPVSQLDPSVKFDRFGIAGGIGQGPAYPIGMQHGVLFLVAASGSDAGSPWAVQKVLWFVHPRYRGPVLIRGRRLDGPGLVRFDRGTLPASDLRVPAGAKERPSFTRLRAAGCYGYQIDGTTFSRVVIFRATGIP